jgi:inner membrane protein
MPTIVTHPAVPLALGLGLGTQVVSPRLLAASAVASILPDADVAAFWFGIPYASPLGHRGLSHSLVFAAAVALLAAAFHRALRTRAGAAFALVFVATASHAVLDAFTDGGLCVALLWPFSDERFFAPERVIQVSPIGLRALSWRGVQVLTSEMLWVWTPCLGVAVALRLARRIGGRSHLRSGTLGSPGPCRRIR